MRQIFKNKKEENWTFLYSFYGVALAISPSLIGSLDLPWAYKIAVFYFGFLALSYLILVNPFSRSLMSEVGFSLQKYATKIIALL